MDETIGPLESLPLLKSRGREIGMRVLTFNPGSEILRTALIADRVTVATRTWDASDARAGERAVDDALERWGAPDAVAVRFVHGGSRLCAVVVDDRVLSELERLVPLEPVHQPVSVGVTRLIRGRLPRIPVVACFDTAFHAGLPEAAARYALPRVWTGQNRLRRYGFHGLSCAYAVRRAAELLAANAGSRLVCCHIGACVSVTAIRDGTSVDTSMGYTPLDGAVMATRSGSVDPGLLTHVLGTGQLGVAELAHVLYHRSGLAGMTGTRGDVREVLAARAAGSRVARGAVDVFLHRLRREIGAAAMSLDRLDALVLTGGVAEHQPSLLGELIAGLPVLRLCADPERLARSGDRMVSPADAAAAILVITAREDLELARQAAELLTRGAA